MPLQYSNPGTLITTVGDKQSCRIAVHVNPIAALQVRTTARQGEWRWESSMGSWSYKVKDGRRLVVVVPPVFRRAFRREFPDLTSRSYIGPTH